MADTSSGGYLYEGERKWRKSHIDILICGLFHRKYLGVQAIRGLGNHDAHFHMMSSTEIWAVVDKVKRDSELKETIFNHWLATSPYDKTVLDNVVKMKLEDRGYVVEYIILFKRWRTTRALWSSLSTELIWKLVRSLQELPKDLETMSMPNWENFRFRNQIKILYTPRSSWPKSNNSPYPKKSRTDTWMKGMRRKKKNIPGLRDHVSITFLPQRLLINWQTSV